MESATRLRTCFPGKRILLVEDEELNQLVALSLLVKAGLEVEVALDGRQAVDRARGEDFDLILMDINMPRLDGIRATQLIRAMPRHRGTPIVALTGNGSAADQDKCRLAGMNAHLCKPVAVELFYQALFTWLNQAAGGLDAAAAQT